jgi:hypothetical protein
MLGGFHALISVTGVYCCWVTGFIAELRRDFTETKEMGPQTVKKSMKKNNAYNTNTDIN